MRTGRRADRLVVGLAFALVLGGCGGSAATPSPGPGHIYWANRGYDLPTNPETTMGRANIDGTGVSQKFITAGHSMFGLAILGDHLYWTDTGTNSIGRANLDGTGVNQSFISATDTPSG